MASSLNQLAASGTALNQLAARTGRTTLLVQSVSLPMVIVAISVWLIVSAGFSPRTPRGGGTPRSISRKQQADQVAIDTLGASEHLM